MVLGVRDIQDLLPDVDPARGVHSGGARVDVPVSVQIDPGLPRSVRDRVGLAQDDVGGRRVRGRRGVPDQDPVVHGVGDDEARAIKEDIVRVLKRRGGGLAAALVGEEVAGALLAEDHGLRAPRQEHATVRPVCDGASVARDAHPAGLGAGVDVAASKVDLCEVRRAAGLADHDIGGDEVRARELLPQKQSAPIGCGEPCPIGVDREVLRPCHVGQGRGLGEGAKGEPGLPERDVRGLIGGLRQGLPQAESGRDAVAHDHAIFP